MPPKHLPARIQADDRPRGQVPASRAGVLEFMQQLWSLDHAMMTRSKWMGRELGVTGPQRLVLRLVGKAPHITAGDLAETLRFDPSTLTGILTRLEAAGMLERIEDPADRRRVRVQLTPRGKQVDRFAKGTIEQAVSRALERSGPEDIAATQRLLQALVAELDRPL